MIIFLYLLLNTHLTANKIKVRNVKKWYDEKGSKKAESQIFRLYFRDKRNRKGILFIGFGSPNRCEIKAEQLLMAESRDAHL